jgi:para-aminobenzoate synthetase component 1
VSRAGECLPDCWESWKDSPVFALLESAQSGRHTYICERAARLIIGDSDKAEVFSGDGKTRLETRQGVPLLVLQTVINERRVPALPGSPAMVGGLIGLFGYDLVRTWERLPASARRDLAVPLYAAVEPRELLIFDHKRLTLSAIAWCEIGDAHEPHLRKLHHETEAAARAAIERFRALRGAAETDRVLREPPSVPSSANIAQDPFGPAAFETAARRIYDYIAAGDTYQVNLSRRTSRVTTLSPEAVYDSLRRVNPSPYMGLFKLPAFALVCGSPELLVKLERGKISSRPIAGTRPRGAVASQDSHLSAELFASEKERAEHLMLVDLIRNDIGRVAEFGSVHVPEFMVLERYSHVMHIVSQVEGQLARDKTWVDVFEAMFPGGTITGCPKIRTMEIIEELEPVGRGFYTGSLGWISYAGDMELNIVIRSMLLLDGIAHVQAGAGIVADSQPARELDESSRKAQALWVALDRAEAGRDPKPDLNRG